LPTAEIQQPNELLSKAWPHNAIYEEKHNLNG